MPTLRLHSIKLTNFKSYGSPGLCIDFNAGNNVIVGENGSGKSSILEGIKLALFGKLSDGRTLEQVIRTNSPQASVELHFSVDEKEFTCTRILSRKVPTKAILEDTSGHEITNGQTNVTKDIEALLGIESHTFEDVVFAEQGDIAKITSDTPGDRRRALMKVLGIERYLQSSESFRFIQRFLENRTVQLLKDIDIVHNEPARIKEMEEKITVITKEVQESEKQRTLVLKQLQDIRTLISVAEKLQNEVSLLEKEEAGHKKTLDTLERQKIEILNILPIEHRTDPQSYATHVNTELRIKHTELKEIQRKISDVDRQLGNLETIFVRLTKQKQQHQKTEHSLQDKLKELNIDQNDIPTIITTTQDQYAKLTTLIKRQLKEVANYEIKRGHITTLNEALVLKQQELKKFLSKHSKREKELKNILGPEILTIDDLDKSIDTIDKKRKEMTLRLEQQDSILQELQTDLGQTQQKLASLDADLENLTSLQGKHTCPLCKRPLEAHELHTLIKEYTEQKNFILREKQHNEQKVAKGRDIQEGIRKQILEQNELYSTLTNAKNTLLDYLQEEKEVIEKKQALKVDEKKLADLMQEHIEEKLLSLTSEQQNLEHQQGELENKLKNLIDAQKDLEKLLQIDTDLHELEKQYDEVTKDNLTKQQHELSRLREESQHTVESLTILYNKIKDFQNFDLNIEKEKKILIDCQTNLNIKFVELKQHDYVSYRKENDRLSELVGKYTAEIKQITTSQLPDLSTQLNEYTHREKMSLELQQQLQTTLKNFDTAKVLSGMLTELPEYAIQEVCNAISDSATYKLKEIITQGTIDRIILESNFNIWILREGAKQDLRQLSGGERVAVGIALRLAMSDLFTKLDFIILDEPTEFLDIQRKNDLVQLLEQSRPLGQLLLVTHEPAFVQCANHVIPLKKIQGKTEKVNPEVLFQQIE